ncbi:hypothetical protein KIL84_007973 [Mauremys mutica]|uniref:Uncharacterized protein n=1 Tax=Mauremys mutica TaxID=74926 RepID=A0A9D3X4F5_9SAUR|nr:hypothetical protein KIL84_007973 [Mauremys mutica]
MFIIAKLLPPHTGDLGRLYFFRYTYAFLCQVSFNVVPAGPRKSIFLNSAKFFVLFVVAGFLSLLIKPVSKASVGYQARLVRADSPITRSIYTIEKLLYSTPLLCHWSLWTTGSNRMLRWFAESRLVMLVMILPAKRNSRGKGK